MSMSMTVPLLDFVNVSDAKNFVTRDFVWKKYEDEVECGAYHHLNVTDVCAFINATADCQTDNGFISYLSFIYCDFSSKLVPLGIVIVFVWWLFLFTGLAVTADNFFCPSLIVISRTLRLSQNIAKGVTFLAFGNGAPDIFSAIAAIGSAKNGDAGLAIGALFGAGVFVTAVVTGTISIIHPFDAMQRPFLRDVIFYLAAVFWSFYMLWKKEIKRLEAIGFILLYVLYVLVVLLGRYIYQRQRHRSTDNTVTIEEPVVQVPDTETEDNEASMSNVLNDGSVRYLSSDEINSGERQPLLKTRSDESERPSVHIEFLQAVNPINTEDWGEMRFYGKIYEVFKSPIVFLLLVTVPVVDYDKADSNWNKPLFVAQCLTGPILSVFSTKLSLIYLGGVFPVWVLALIIGLLFAVIVYFTSKRDQPPVYLPAFGFLGFFVAVIWIYSIANEVVNILQMFGIYFGISNAILGLTFLAWGNSVGDFIANTAMARKGEIRTGISACFGGPLFNLLLGIGIPFTIATVKNGTYKLEVSLEQLVLAGFLALSLLSSLIIVPLLKFRMSRGYGIYLIIFYIVFLIIAILTETGVIHAKF